MLFLLSWVPSYNMICFAEGVKVIAQAAQFFTAGFETTSSVIAFTLYELCLNQHIQDKLRKEIRACMQKHGNYTYESLQDMKYLHQCIQGRVNYKNIYYKWVRTPTVITITFIFHQLFELSSRIKKITNTLCTVYSLLQGYAWVAESFYIPDVLITAVLLFMLCKFL